MRAIQLLLCTILFAMWLPAAAADGLVYRLPQEGTWAKFAVEGMVLDADENAIDPVLNITGSLTISCVGTERRGEEVCRWIEILIEAQRDGRAFKEVDKLLIPEKEIGAGKKPLAHLREAWYLHSAVDNGTPRQLNDQEKVDIVYRQRVRSILHPPFENVQQGGEAIVKCKLGRVQCTKVTAEENEKHPGSKIEYGSSYVICLRQEAPFGVTAWQAINRVRRGGQLVGATKLNMVLTDFGQGAKSRIPASQ